LGQSGNTARNNAEIAGQGNIEKSEYMHMTGNQNQ
jgi:hypothetical protein